MSSGMVPFARTELEGIEAARLLAGDRVLEGKSPASMQTIEQHPRWMQLARLPVLLAARIPIRGFTVRDLLTLAPGSLLKTEWPAIEDVPLRIGQVQLAWCEFETLDKKMGVRITRVA